LPTIDFKALTLHVASNAIFMGQSMNSSTDHEDEVRSQEQDKLECLLNTLKGYEEFVLDDFGIIISSNLEAVTLTGYEEWEVIGKHFSIFYPEEDIRSNKPEKDLRKAAKLGSHITSGLRLKKRGDQFWAKMKVSVLNKEKDSIAGYRLTLSDTTHRKMYHMNVQKIKDEYLNLFNSSFAGIFKFSIRDYSCMQMNDMATAMLSIEENLKPRLNEIFFSSSDFDRFINLLYSSKKVENFEFQFNHPNQEKYYSINCKLFKVGGFVEGIVTDVTDRRAQLRELEHLKAELDTFLYRVSHDIRSPIATVLGLLNLVNYEKQLGAERSIDSVFDYTGKMQERVKHLDDLLANLSVVAFNNTQEMVPQFISPNEYLRSVISSIKKLYPSVKFSVKIDMQSEFYGDSIRLGPILFNVISNACKYACPDKPEQMVKILFKCNYHSSRIIVEDNGKGIGEQYLKDIFKQFFQIDSQGTGAGLGLYVVNTLTKTLGGNVGITSELGKGTTVTIDIPNMNPGAYFI
jgi:PAS domain S-box-containing protein